MNKKIKNIILYGILMAIVLGFALSPMLGKEILWNSDQNVQIPFSGIHFDKLENISAFKIKRYETPGQVSSLISYDVEFEYTGSESSMRIMGKLAEQAFFGENVSPIHSKATLKGEYEKINNLLFNEKLTNRDLFKNLQNYKFSSTSEIRVPLNEEVKNYKFKITYLPKTLVYENNKELAKASVFLTNARVDNFTDGDYLNKSETQSFNESGMYVNAIEVYNEETIKKIDLFNNINNIIFILSVIITLGLIWIDRPNTQYFIIIFIFISILTVYRFLETGVSTLGAFTVFPILGFLGVLVGRLTSREKITFNKYDFSQGLLGAILLMILSIFLYLLPR